MNVLKKSKRLKDTQCSKLKVTGLGHSHTERETFKIKLGKGKASQGGGLRILLS